MASHHVAKIDPALFKKLERISESLIELLEDKDFECLCVCDEGDAKYGVQPTICDIHELAAIVLMTRNRRDFRKNHGRHEKELPIE